MPHYIVQWNDPNNSVCRKGAVEYNGKTVFDSLEEAKEAFEFDKAEELDLYPKSEMTWVIMELHPHNNENRQLKEDEEE